MLGYEPINFTRYCHFNENKMIRDDADVSIDVRVSVGLPASSSSDAEKRDRKIG